MSTVAVACLCHTIGAPTEVRQCPEHFSIYRGDKRLVSVSRIIAMYPQDPCNQCGMPVYSKHLAGCRVREAIDNAQDRGKLVDSMFARYVTGEAVETVGVRVDAVKLLDKLVNWFERQNFRSVQAQVLLADNEVGGACDFIFDGALIDLKATCDISPTNAIQVGGYVSLHDRMYGHALKPALLHVTERYSEPKWIPLSIPQVMGDFETCRAMYRLHARTK